MVPTLPEWGVGRAPAIFHPAVSRPVRVACCAPSKTTAARGSCYMRSHLLHDPTLVCTLKFVCQVPLRCMRAVNEQQVCEAERHGVWLEEHLTLWPIRYFHLVEQIGTQSGRMAYQSSQRRGGQPMFTTAHALQAILAPLPVHMQTHLLVAVINSVPIAVNHLHQRC